MLARPHIVSADHWVCEATDTGGNYQSETACRFYKDARGLKITNMDTFDKD